MLIHDQDLSYKQRRFLEFSKLVNNLYSMVLKYEILNTRESLGQPLTKHTYSHMNSKFLLTNLYIEWRGCL
jgi:hypothetical protein